VSRSTSQPGCSTSPSFVVVLQSFPTVLEVAPMVQPPLHGAETSSSASSLWFFNLPSQVRNMLVVATARSRCRHSSRKAQIHQSHQRVYSSTNT